MTRPVINGISAFFIVRNVVAAVAFYRDKLGFEVSYQEPKDDPFFAIVSRGGAMVMVKSVGASPAPNSTRHAWA
jgi:catechol 2,3-dioxygenase-like lactoylglutathione lyase family enzyme